MTIIMDDIMKLIKDSGIDIDMLYDVIALCAFGSYLLAIENYIPNKSGVE